ncbi:MAG TPA: response regulator [Verrucomicrobiae bacterium]|nr:response regulator [Verrucomicrobiae bacterium]
MNSIQVSVGGLNGHVTAPRDDDVVASAAPIQNKSINRLLVVDDDCVLREFCADALTVAGYFIDTAEDGAAGWQALQGMPYNLVLTDNRMPKVSGIELVKRMRSQGMDLPVVLTSSAIPTAEIERDPSLQLAATLLKPFSIAELLDTVQKVLTAEIHRRNGQNELTDGFNQKRQWASDRSEPARINIQQMKVNQV